MGLPYILLVTKNKISVPSVIAYDICAVSTNESSSECKTFYLLTHLLFMKFCKALLLEKKKKKKKLAFKVKFKVHMHCKMCLFVISFLKGAQATLVVMTMYIY